MAFFLLSDQPSGDFEVYNAWFYAPGGSLLKKEIWFTHQWLVHQQSALWFMHPTRVNQNWTEKPYGKQKAFECVSCCVFR